MPADQLVNAVAEALPARVVGRDISLASLSRYRIGGPADLVITPSSPSELRQALLAVKKAGLTFVIIGDGSNLLFDDAGFRGAVIVVGRALGGVSFLDDGQVKVGAGHWAPFFVRKTINAGLEGLVHAIGIPGTIGGLVVMNGGSQRRGVSEYLTEVEVMTLDGDIQTLKRQDLDFGYRRSPFQDGDRVILSATFRLPKGDAAALRREAIEIMASRRSKFPRNTANCGSVFVSDPALYDLIGPPGKAIEAAGLKGVRFGGAQFSPDHANFIVNNGGARSADVLTLIARARRDVEKLTGVAMAAEVRHLGPTGRLQPAHDVIGEYSNGE
jgi:UDP-N-acetylmuramate dehydrogenase